MLKDSTGGYNLCHVPCMDLKHRPNLVNPACPKMQSVQAEHHPVMALPFLAAEWELFGASMSDSAQQCRNT